jgi:hypothetical protein
LEVVGAEAEIDVTQTEVEAAVTTRIQPIESRRGS